MGITPSKTQCKFQVERQEVVVVVEGRATKMNQHVLLAPFKLSRDIDASRLLAL